MKRSLAVALGGLYLTFFSAGSSALALSPGDTLGNGQIRVLTLQECRDIHPSQHIENTQNAQHGEDDSESDSDDTARDSTPSSPAKQSDIQPEDLDKKSFSLGLFNFKPDGAPQRIRTDECSADHLQDMLLKNRASMTAQAAIVSDFFKTCHTTVRRQGDGDLGAMLKTASAVYNPCDNPRINAVEIKLPDGTKLRGLLGLQNSKKPLPFVIFKDGAFSNSSSASARVGMMSLFDQMPVNILTLGNVTGSDFLRDNGHVSLGGFDEGMQLIQVAKVLRSSELDKRTSEIHIMAVSLGGEAALFASYYNSWQPLVKGKPLVASIFAQSPVVDLKSSMGSVFSPGVKWKIVRGFLLGDFFEVLANIPFLSDTLKLLKSVSNASEMPGVIADAAVQYYAKTPTSWGLSPYVGLRIKSADELWARNNFLPMAKINFTTPTFVLGADNDWVVEPENNSIALQDALDEDAPKASNMKVVILDRGNHCAFDAALGWDIYTGLMNGWMISHSPSLIARRHFETAPIGDDDLKKFGKLQDDEKTVDYHLEFSEKKDYMKITLDQVDDDHADDDFCDLEPEQLGDDCLKRTVVKISLDKLPSWARQPVNKTDAQALNRWANTNIRLVSDDGTLIGLNNKNPAAFKWVSFE